MSEERAAYVTAADAEESEEAEAQTPAEIAAGHVRHYAAMLAAEEVGTAGWHFVFGQLSAASALASAFRRGRKSAENAGAFLDADSRGKTPSIT